MPLFGLITNTSVEVARETPHIRREHFTFAHEGNVDDIATIRRRLSPRRAFQLVSASDTESLFAYVLTCIDAAEDTDLAVLRSVSDIASSGVRGNFNFLLATERALYAHRGGRAPLGFADRSDALIVSTNPMGTDAWRQLSCGSLIKLDRGASLSWRMLAGGFEVSEPELPFTD